jgi:hypothetical protein
MPDTSVEARIRSALLADVDGEPFRPVAPGVVARARRRLVRNAVAAALVGIAVLAGSIAGVGALAHPSMTTPGHGRPYVPDVGAFLCCLPPSPSLIYGAADGTVRYMVPGVGSRWPVLHSAQAVAVGRDGTIAEVTSDGWLGIYLGGHDFAPIQEDVGTVTGASIRPDAEQIVYTTPDGLFGEPIAGEAEPTALVPARPGELLSSPTWSPDGTRLAFVSTSNGDSALKMLEVATQQVSTVRDGVVSAAWSPSDNTIAAFGPDGVGLLLIDSSTGRPRTIDPSATSATAPAWSPDGSRLAFLGPEGRAAVIRPDGTELESDVHLPGIASDSPLFWSPGTSGP